MCVMHRLCAELVVHEAWCWCHGGVAVVMAATVVAAAVVVGASATRMVAVTRTSALLGAMGQQREQECERDTG